jgi:hypothetical protein
MSITAPTISSKLGQTPVFGSVRPTNSVASSSTESRSRTMASILFRSQKIPRDCVGFLCGTTSTEGLGGSTELNALFSELLVSAVANESNSQAAANRLTAKIAPGLADACQLLFESQKAFDASVGRTLLLRSLMPLYLAAGSGKLGSAVTDSKMILRDTWVLSELVRSLKGTDLAEWLLAHHSQEPFSLFNSTFNLSISTISGLFWKSASDGSLDDKQVVASMSTTESLRSAAYWSLAAQFVGQSDQMIVPKNIAIGLIAWDKLTDHWQRLTLALEKNVGLASKKPSSKPIVQSKSVAIEPILNDRRFVEIRSVSDPQLSTNLDRMLGKCRSDQSSMSILVVKKLDRTSGKDESIAIAPNWQSKFIQLIDSVSSSGNVRGFITDEGDLTLVYEDAERSEIAHWIREAFEYFSGGTESDSLATKQAVPLVSGVASVVAPSRTFKIEQLISAAWRCLDGASNQGAGAVKTIEVY